MARASIAAAGLAFILLLGACSPGTPIGNKSVLIIAIPNFRADDLGCNSSSDSITPQLDVICAESVRFTHAYTPSVLVVPALASVLTGLYPFEHGIHRNDESRYAPGVKSLPEFAREKGYDTFLASGGVPVLEKTGVERGFDDFDDAVRIDGSFYRSADETVQKFLSLLESRGGEAPFFAVVDFADLSFPEAASPKTNQSEKHEGTYNGKLQEIDDAIGGLRNQFKKMKIWDPLTVIIVGLQGTNRGEHDGLSKGLSLYDEIVRVPLLVKPGRKARDQGPSWKVDEPVNLVDLGATLFKILGVNDAPKSGAPVREFSGALQARDFQEEERPLFCESDLPPWRGWGPRMISVRKGEWAYWAPPEEKLFDTYSDRLELRNLFNLDLNMNHAMESVWRTFAPKLADHSKDAPHFMPISIGEKIKGAQTVFSRVSEPQERLAALTELEIRRPDDWQIIEWHVRELMNVENWAALKELLASHRPAVGTPETVAQSQEYSTWQIFLRMKLKTKLHDNEVIRDPAENCLFLALAMKHFNTQEIEYFQTQQACKDHETQAWVSSFLHYKDKKMKEANAFFELARSLTEKREDQEEFSKYFWLDGATWDFPKELPGGPSTFEMFELLAANPEFQTYIKKKQLP